VSLGTPLLHQRGRATDAGHPPTPNATPTGHLNLHSGSQIGACPNNLVLMDVRPHNLVLIDA